MTRIKIALLLSTICTASVSAAIITPALPQIQHDFHVSSSATHWLVSIFLLGYVIGQLIYGPLADKIGRLPSLRFGLTLNLFGILVSALAVVQQHYDLLLLGRLITALGSAAGLVCTLLLVNELLPEEKAKHALSFSVVAFTVGIGVAVSVGGFLTEYASWAWCFAFLFVHGLVMLLITFCFSEPTVQQPCGSNLALLDSLKLAFSNRQLVSHALLAGFFTSFCYGFSAAAPLYSQYVLGLDASQYGYWNGLNMLGMLLSGFVSSMVISRFGVKQLLYGAIMVVAPLLVGLYSASMSHSTIAFFTATSLFYLFGGLLFPAASYFASNALANRAIASSALSFINIASALFAVIIMGYLPFQAITNFITALAVFYLLAVVIMLTNVKTAHKVKLS